jgi:hypothetical protein
MSLGVKGDPCEGVAFCNKAAVFAWSFMSKAHAVNHALLNGTMVPG